MVDPIFTNPDPRIIPEPRFKTPPIDYKYNKHDSLHMAEGLTQCWCMCRMCFLYLTWGNKKVGYCICHKCPCEQKPPGLRLTI